jgi:8-oxo-dGTP pyrophosphatase MutT (NUDIX family)
MVQPPSSVEEQPKVRRAHIIATWVICTLLGGSLLALPDRGPRLFSLSDAHGPGLVDTVGAVLVLAGAVPAWWWIWRDRRRLAAAPPWWQVGAPLSGGLGLGLVAASVFGDFPQWWAVGAALLTLVQAGLLGSVSGVGAHRPTRVRVTGYVTRGSGDALELLVFEYPSTPGTHLPGGGVEPGELLNDAMVRETYEETGVAGPLSVLSVVGVQSGRFADTRRPFLNVYFHLRTDDDRSRWQHTMVGDPGAWDTGLLLTCRFIPLGRAHELLRDTGNTQHAFLHLLTAPAPDPIP